MAEEVPVRSSTALKTKFVRLISGRQKWLVK
jgi:hypothetical protein